MRYLPFLNGVYSVAPGLKAMQKSVNAEDAFVFSIDDDYLDYINNKNKCRKENINKYYFTNNLDPFKEALINQYIAEQLIKEYPQHFSIDIHDDIVALNNHQTQQAIAFKSDWLRLVNNSKYSSLFDALCSQLQEDAAVCCIDDNGKDWLAAMHICSPNYWAPEKKIGKPFNAVHQPVPGMQKTLNDYLKMLLSVVHKGPFTRFAWGVVTDKKLNHHPQPAINHDEEDWIGRKANDDVQFYIRTEKQNLVGLPQINSFLFTIRTYFYDVALLNNTEKEALVNAVNSMSDESLMYKGMFNNKHILLQQLTATM